MYAGRSRRSRIDPTHRNRPWNRDRRGQGIPWVYRPKWVSGTLRTNPVEKMVEAAGIETRMGVSRLCAKMREKARIHWSKCAFRALSSVVGNRTETHENAEILSSIVINETDSDRRVLFPLSRGERRLDFRATTRVSGVNGVRRGWHGLWA